MRFEPEPKNMSNQKNNNTLVEAANSPSQRLNNVQKISLKKPKKFKTYLLYQTDIKASTIATHLHLIDKAGTEPALQWVRPAHQLHKNPATLTYN